MALETCSVFLSFDWSQFRMVPGIAFLLKRTWFLFLLCSATSWPFSAVGDHEEMCIPDHSSYKMCSCLSRALVYIATCDGGNDRMGVAWGDPLQSRTLDANQLLCSLDTDILDMRLSTHLFGSSRSGDNLCSSFSSLGETQR